MDFVSPSHVVCFDVTQLDLVDDAVLHIIWRLEAGMPVEIRPPRRKNLSSEVAITVGDRGHCEAYFCHARVLVIAEVVAGLVSAVDDCPGTLTVEKSTA